MFKRKMVFDTSNIDISSKIGCRMSILRMYATEKGIENIDLAKAKELCSFLLDDTELPGIEQPPVSGFKKVESFIDSILGLGKKYKGELNSLAEFVSGFRGTPDTSDNDAEAIPQLPLPDEPEAAEQPITPENE